MLSCSKVGVAEAAPERINRPFGPPYFKLLDTGEDRLYWTSMISKESKAFLHDSSIF